MGTPPSTKPKKVRPHRRGALDQAMIPAPERSSSGRARAGQPAHILVAAPRSSGGSARASRRRHVRRSEARTRALMRLRAVCRLGAASGSRRCGYESADSPKSIQGARSTGPRRLRRRHARKLIRDVARPSCPRERRAARPATRKLGNPARPSTNAAESRNRGAFVCIRASTRSRSTQRKFLQIRARYPPRRQPTLITDVGHIREYGRKD